MTKTRRPQSRTNITAIVALITAAAALGLGVWENVQIREHNRLSVTLHLQLTAEFHAADDETAERAIIRVQNEGVGPAVIEQVEVIVTDGDGTERRFATWGDASRLLEDLQGASLKRRMELGPEGMLGVEAIHDIAIFEKQTDDVGEPLFPSLLGRLDVRISYRSIYGEPFEADLQQERTLAGA